MIVVPEEDKTTNDGAPILSVLPKRGRFGAIFSRTLPKYSGPHCVGVSDLEVPVSPQQLFGTFIHKSMPNGKTGLVLETSLISLFYPAKVKSGTTEKTIWFPKLKQTVDGFLRMASRVPNALMRAIAYPVAAAAIYGTTFPAAKDSKLSLPPEGKKWPVIIFSHGVGCSRLMYTAICGELASHGYVVACVESRDGTGPSSSISNKHGEHKALDFINWRDLDWPDLKTQPPDDTHLRHVQLSLRLAEFESVLSILTKINQGEGNTLLASSLLSPDWNWLDWKDKLMMKDGEVVIMGHSFGGSAAIKACVDERFKFSKVVVMDPAIQRLEPWESTISIPFLAINSQEFTDGMDDDYPRLLKVLDSAPRDKSYLFNIARATHPSFSDIHLILPKFINRMMGLKDFGPEQVLQLQLNTSLTFLRGHNDALVKSCSRTEGEGNRILFYALD